MRYLKLLVLLSMLLILAAGQASADAVDPQIIVRGGVGHTIYLTGQVVTINFSGTPGCDVPSTQPGTGFPMLSCGFVNNTNGFINNLQFSISPANQLPLTLICTICQVDPTGNANGTLATFILNLGLIGPGDDFLIEFVNFSQNTGIGVATNVPEPGTLALMFTGVGALIARRRMRKGLPVAV